MPKRKCKFRVECSNEWKANSGEYNSNLSTEHGGKCDILERDFKSIPYF